MHPTDDLRSSDESFINYDVNWMNCTMLPAKPSAASASMVAVALFAMDLNRGWKRGNDPESRKGEKAAMMWAGLMDAGGETAVGTPLSSAPKHHHVSEYLPTASRCRGSGDATCRANHWVPSPTKRFPSILSPTRRTGTPTNELHTHSWTINDMAPSL